MTPEERIIELENSLRDVTERLDQIDNNRPGFLEFPDLEVDQQIPLASEVGIISTTQAAKRTDLVVGWSNPDPGYIDHFELWATNVTGQSKQPYLVASVTDSPAAFSVTSDQDTAVAIAIRTFTKDGLSSTLGGSPSVGASIVQTLLGAGDLAAGSVGDSKLDRVTDPISMQTADIASLAVTNAKIDSLSASKLTAGTIDASIITVSNLNASNITTGTLAAGIAVLGTVLAAQVQAGTLSSVNISAGTYTLTSGFEQMTIDGTNGFQQSNTSSNQVAKILGGTFTASSTATANRTVAFNNLVLNGRNTSAAEVWALRNDLTDMGQSNSGYFKVANSSGSARVRLGVDANGDGTVQLDGHLSLDEIGNTPATPSSSTEARIYLRGDNLIIQFNDAGTVRYKYLDLTGTGVTWVHSTTAPT